jgi:hypothetical protein
MKTYLVTKEDIERLRCNLDSGGDEVYWYISQLDNWEETLSYKTNEPYDDLQREIDNLKKMLDDNI